MPHKSLFCMEQKGSLHRHQTCTSLIKQILTGGSAKANRLFPTDSDWVKAARGQLSREVGADHV